MNLMFIKGTCCLYIHIGRSSTIYTKRWLCNCPSIYIDIYIYKKGSFLMLTQPCPGPSITACPHSAGLF